MAGPLVSVVVTYKDARPYLDDLVKSVFAQTMEDWELLMVDDGSSDGSVERLRAIQDERVRLLCDGQHRGTAVRRNELTRSARGRYLAVMDADDVMHPQRLELQVDRMSRSDTDVVGGAMYTMDARGCLTGMMHSRPADVGLRAVLKNGLLFHGTVMASRDWFLGHPYAPEFVRAQDYELWCRTVGTSTFGAVDDALIFYRQSAQLDLRKYRRNCRANRRILGLHGRQFGRSFVVRQQAVSLGKEAVAAVLSTVGASALMVNLRHEPLTPVEHVRAQQALDLVSDTVVPGW